MKNIHILPTSQPSRLRYFCGRLERMYAIPKKSNIEFQNIYITSDEEIKEGDSSFYPPFGVGKNIIIDGELCFHIEAKNGKGSFTQRTYQTLDSNKKIILTTDLELQKDGVQKIDDEFLEWFVKNPSCEEVVVIYEPKNFFDVKKGWEYKIIIPKEEPNIIDQWLEKNGNPEITKQVDEEAKKLQKQHLIDMMKSDEELGLYEQTKCYCGHTITCDCGPEQEIKLEEVFNDDKKENIKKFIDEINNPSEPNQALKDAAERLKGKELFKESNDRARKTLSEIKSLPKQETLEEVAERYKYNPKGNFCFIEGYKLAQERSYSEEEVIKLLQKAITHQDDGETGSLVTVQGKIRPANFFSWFEKFKKK